MDFTEIKARNELYLHHGSNIMHHNNAIFGSMCVMCQDLCGLLFTCAEIVALLFSDHLRRNVCANLGITVPANYVQSRTKNDTVGHLTIELPYQSSIYHNTPMVLSFRLLGLYVVALNVRRATTPLAVYMLLH